MAHWSDLESRAQTVALQLWDRPELGLDEHFAADLLTSWLAEEGFAIDRGVADLPTAFMASAGAGTTVGILAEYDALPGLSNEARAARAPRVAGGPGHGCGHNLIAAANTAAAIAVSRALRETSHQGQVVVFGTPAEEVLVGKLVMLQDGLFERGDVLLTSHADYQNAALSRPCMAVASAEFVFTGQQGHTGWARTGSALDAAELFVATFERLRSHRLAGISIEHVLRSPHPVVPNVVPEQVRVWCFLRHPDTARAAFAYQVLCELARQAAESANTAVVPLLLACTRGYLPNDELGRLLDGCLRREGAPGWTSDELAQLGSFAMALGASPEIRAELETGVLTEGTDPYGQDDGEVSWTRPLGRVNWAIPAGVPLHSWAAAAMFGTAAAWKGAAMASRTLTRATAELLLSPQAAERATQELEARIARAEPPPGLAGEVARTGADLWNAGWLPPG